MKRDQTKAKASAGKKQNYSWSSESRNGEGKVCCGGGGDINDCSFNSLSHVT